MRWMGSMPDILHRIELHSEEQGTAAMRAAWPWALDQLRQGRALVAEYRLLDDDITARQRGYLHAVVLTEISRFARVNGQQFPMKVWKEHFRSEFLGFEVITCVNPMTGRKSRRRVRVSTEDLGVRGMAEYIDRVIAFAATDLGVQVSEPLPPELRPGRRHPVVEATTGEILESA